MRGSDGEGEEGVRREGTEMVDAEEGAEDPEGRRGYRLHKCKGN